MRQFFMLLSSSYLLSIYSIVVKDASEWIHSPFSLLFVYLPHFLIPFDDDLHWTQKAFIFVKIYLLKKRKEEFSHSSPLLISIRACHRLVLNSSSFPQFACSLSHLNIHRSISFVLQLMLLLPSIQTDTLIQYTFCILCVRHDSMVK